MGARTGRQFIDGVQKDPQEIWIGGERVVGPAVFVQAKEDNLKSQPGGEAGARLACGVIGIAEPK